MKNNFQCLLVMVYLFSSLNSLHAQWQTTSQPGAVTDVISGGSNLYVNNGGTIYLSPDGGTTWTTYYGLPHGSGVITTIFVNSGTIFAGTSSSGLYRSSDNGTNWFPADSGMSVWYNHISTLYSLGDTVFVSTIIGDDNLDTGRVFRSVNGGLYWTAADSGLPNSIVHYNQYYGTGVSAFTSIGSTLYAAFYNSSSEYGLYKSTNYGISWSNVLNSLYILAFGSSDGNLLISVVSGIPGSPSFLVSTDGGLTWQPDITGFSASVSGVNVIASSGSEVFAGTSGGWGSLGPGVYRSTDNGINWAASSKGIFGTPTVFNFAFQGTTIFAAITNNLYRSNDGGSNWNLISNGLPGDTLGYGGGIRFGTYVYSLVEKGSKLFAGTGANGVYVSTDAGITWSAANYGLPYPQNEYLTAMTVSDSALIVALEPYTGATGIIYRSTDDGANWTDVNPGITPVNQLAAIGSNVIAAAASGGFLSTDGGISWISLYGTGGFPAVKPINVAFAQNSVFFAGGGSAGIVRSTNGGTVWAEADSGVGVPPNVTVSSIGGDGKNVYAATSGGLFKSQDDGISWTSLNSGFPLGSSDYISSLAGGSGEIVAFTNYLGNNVFLSTDGGSLWTSIKNGLIPTVIQSALVFNGKLFIGLTGGNPWGVWYYELPAATSVNDNFAKGSPSNFELEQNYPNPFNPGTTIKYSIPKFGLVTIKIYDILGREVKTLVNEEKNAGNYTVEFNAGRLVSGVYLYRMQAGNFVQSKKLILMK